MGFAEWLALTYAHEGIKVSVLCPQAVRTPMVMSNPENDSARAAATENYMQRKTADYDRWIAGMNRLFRKLSGIA